MKIETTEDNFYYTVSYSRKFKKFTYFIAFSVFLVFLAFGVNFVTSNFLEDPILFNIENVTSFMISLFSFLFFGVIVALNRIMGNDIIFISAPDTKIFILGNKERFKIEAKGNENEN